MKIEEISAQDYLVSMQEIVKIYEKTQLFKNSLNKQQSRIYLQSKILWIENNKVFRLETPAEIYKRILIRELAKEYGDGIEEIFAEEKIIKKNQLFVLSEQEIFEDCQEKLLGEINFQNSIFKNKVIKDYGEQFAIETEEYWKLINLIGIHNKNIGMTIKENKIKIFDYIANVSVMNLVDGYLDLYNGQGQIIFTKKESELY